MGFFRGAPMGLNERQARFLSCAGRLAAKFVDDRCMTYASALSFSSLLSVVPFLAIVFSILKVLDVHSVVAPVILSSVAGGSHAVVSRILEYIANTRVTSLGVVGLAALLFSVMATLDSLEDAFNQICGIERGKAYHRKLRDFLVVIVTIPLMTALAVSLTTIIQHQGVVRWLLHLPGFGRGLVVLFRTVPYLSIWIALVCSYKLIPNARIRLANAVKGGFIAGVLWQAAHWLFVHLQIGVSRYNAIYGTLALLPVFMVWLMTAWCIVLAGMQIVWLLEVERGTADFRQHENGNLEYSGPNS